MRTIAKLGAVLVTAVTLLASSAWALPDKGKSEQWIYGQYDVSWEWLEEAPCLGETVQLTGTVHWRVNFHLTPNKEQGYTRQYVMQDGDLLATGLTSGKVYVLRAGMCWNENAQGRWSVGGDSGTDTIHFVFEAEDGTRLILKGMIQFIYDPDGDPAYPWINLRIKWEWSCRP